jgi:hypothetical protein
MVRPGQGEGVLLRPRRELMWRYIAARYRALWPLGPLIAAMYVLINAENQWSELWQPLILLLIAAVLTVVGGAVTWPRFFANARVVAIPDSITKVGMFTSKRFARNELARVQKAVLISGRYRDPTYFFVDSRGSSLFALPTSLWSAGEIESFCNQIGLPVTGSFERSVLNRIGQMRLPPTSEPDRN